LSVTYVIARQQLRSLSRQRTFLIMLSVLLLMTALSGYIGWSSHSTIIKVYDQTVQTLRAAGKPIPPNPFANQPSLALLDNMIVYIPLIGALLAALVGHMSMMSDRVAGVTRLLFSRPVARSRYFRGKLLGSAIAIVVIMAGCFVLSLASVTIIHGSFPGGTDVLRLSGFFALSALYLVVFALIGMVTSLLSRSQSVALLAAVAVWIVITFMIPEFTSGLHPTASLNPLNEPVSTSASGFFSATSTARPASVSEQYKMLSGEILTPGGGSVSTAAGRILPIAIFLALLAGAANLLLARHDFSRDAARD
jgi:ABC-type transport system involved in multi-copper enzyme maturation permease subunit